MNQNISTETMNILQGFIQDQMHELPAEMQGELFQQFLALAVDRAYMDSLLLSDSENVIDMLTSDVSEPEQFLQQFVTECPAFMNALKYHIQQLIDDYKMESRIYLR